MKKLTDNHLAMSALISLGKSSGTGMIYRTEKKAYLITAKHVLFDEQLNLRAKEIELVAQTVASYDDSVIRFIIDLEKTKPLFHQKSDVTIVVIAESPDGKSYPYSAGVERIEKAYTKGIMTKRENVNLLEEVIISADVYVSGYPTSLGITSSPQFNNNKPLLRKGIVANIYKETNTIILDCPVYGGNSGGPVIQVIEHGDKKQYKVIGIISQFIPFVQKWRNDRDRLEHQEYMNSGYSVATSFDMVLELIAKLES